MTSIDWYGVGDEAKENLLHLWLKYRAWLGVITILCLCAFIGLDRHRLQQRILALERQVDGIMLAKDMQDYRSTRSSTPSKGITFTFRL